MTHAEINDEKNSTTGISQRTLPKGDPRDPEGFLVDLANLRIDDQSAARRFWTKYETVLPPGLAKRITMIRLWESPYSPAPEIDKSLAQDEIDHVTLAVKAMQQEVRRAWSLPTHIDRYLAFLLAAGRYIIAVAAGFPGRESKLDPVFMPVLPEWATFGQPGIEIPAELRADFFVSRLVHAMRFSDRMRVCGNNECPAPYFIALRRSQKYCSEVCALPSQREFKRLWWDEHRDEWRAKRKRQTERGRKSSRTRRKGEKRS